MHVLFFISDAKPSSPSLGGKSARYRIRSSTSLMLVFGCMSMTYPSLFAPHFWQTLRASPFMAWQFLHSHIRCLPSLPVPAAPSASCS